MQSVGSKTFVPTTIYNSNLHFIASRLKELGFELNILGKLPDDAEEHAKKNLCTKMRRTHCMTLTTNGVLPEKFATNLIAPGVDVINIELGYSRRMEV